MVDYELFESYVPTMGFSDEPYVEVIGTSSDKKSLRKLAKMLKTESEEKHSHAISLEPSTDYYILSVERPNAIQRALRSGMRRIA